MRPMRKNFSRCFFRSASTDFTFFGGTTRIIPTPILKDFSNSPASIFPGIVARALNLQISCQTRKDRRWRIAEILQYGRRNDSRRSAEKSEVRGSRPEEAPRKILSHRPHRARRIRQSPRQLLGLPQSRVRTRAILCWRVATWQFLARHILQNIDNHIRIPVEDDDVRPNHAAPVFRGKRRQLAFESHGTRLHALLQSWRQRAIPFQLLLESRWEISSALGQPGRQV